MHITQKLLDPSRQDAVRLRRTEKMAMLCLMYAGTILDDVQTDIPERLDMVVNGRERMQKVAADLDELLHDLRVTVPENQRIGIQNTAMDYEVRLTPKLTPSETNVVMTKEEFRSLVDFAREHCSNCVDDDEECAVCELYKVLTSTLPMDDYHGSNLCPYNLGQWGN